jgi:hypothetical protein
MNLSPIYNKSKLSLTGRITSGKVCPFVQDCCWSRNCPANQKGNKLEYSCSFAKEFDKVQMHKPSKQQSLDVMPEALF